MEILTDGHRIYVVKRSSKKECFRVDKLHARIKNVCWDLDMNFIDPREIAQKVFDGAFDGVSTTQLDTLAAEISASLTTKHPDYSILAARIAISSLHKQTNPRFSEVMEELFNFCHPSTGKHLPKIAKEIFDIIRENSARLNDAIVADRDFSFNYFGFKTLEKSYLIKINEKVVERPQHFWMRVAIGIHKNDIDSAIQTYNYMSEKWFIHASPTLYNAGTPLPQLMPCFLMSVEEDSVECIFETIKKCAKISKYAGGIGLNVSKVGASDTEIDGTSKGLCPMLRVFNNAARFVNQGGNKRPGAFAIYVEPWHADIFDFLALKKPNGFEEERARDLFLGLWIPNLFMKRVEDDEMWSLMCPNDCPGLDDRWGEEFEKLYTQYEKEKRFRRQVEARSVWKAIIASQIETGTPYMLYKDSCNSKSNQQNLGTIKCSNLCTEIIEYSSANEMAVCNVASIALPKFVTNLKEFDYEKLHEITKVVAVNLNKIIDVTYYPTEEAKLSNQRHRPIGIGVQGLADTFQLLRFPFTSESAKTTNKFIFETIYHAALEASNELAQKFGTYESYHGSPISRGILQHDMWNVTPSNLWDWGELRAKISKFGIRNSLLVAPMPTATTAQILGNNESFEPYTSNIYSRRVLSGDFQIVNQHLVKDFIERNLWNKQTKNFLIANAGSVQGIPGVSEELKELYKTVWEISQREIIDMAANRAPFIDQSQSLNIHIASPSYAKITSMHFYAWKKGLKTGMYYLRSRPAAEPVKFTVDKEALCRAQNTEDKFQN